MARMFRVEAGVPIPAHDRRGTKYPFENLAIGESFFVPEDFGITSNALRSAVNQANTRWALEEPNRRFVSRRVSHSGRTGTRVWRVPLNYKLSRGIPNFEGMKHDENGGGG